jgi:hypothetical protein
LDRDETLIPFIDPGDVEFSFRSMASRVPVRFNARQETLVDDRPTCAPLATAITTFTDPCETKTAWHRRPRVVELSPIDRVLDRFFVWLVASLASVEAIGQAGDSYLDGRLEKVVLWATAAIVMVAGTYALEMIKSERFQ